MRTARAAAFIACCVAIAVFVAVPALRAQRRSFAEPQARIVAQQKISAPLMKELYRRRGDTRRVQAGATGVRVDRHGRTLVTIHAVVNDPLKRKITALGGRIVSTSIAHQSVTVLMPVTMLERLAADGTVSAITSN